MVSFMPPLGSSTSSTAPFAPPVDERARLVEELKSALATVNFPGETALAPKFFTWEEVVGRNALAEVEIVAATAKRVRTVFMVMSW